MRVLALVSATKALRLQSALAERAEIRLLSSLRETRELAETPAGVVVIGSEAFCLIQPSEERASMRLLREIRAPIIAYVDVRDARRIFPVIRHVASDVLISGVDDDPTALRNTVLGASRSTVRFVLRLLDDRLTKLPPLIAGLVRDAFEAPEAVFGIESWLGVRGPARRTLYRYFGMAGLSTPGHLLRAARISRACDLFWRQPTPSSPLPAVPAMGAERRCHMS
jgi:hypothetical protein